MTISEIKNQVNQFKPLNRRNLYYYFAALKIEPIGARQRPQQYPSDSANRILAHLGFAKSVKILTVKEAKRHAGKRGAK